MRSSAFGRGDVGIRAVAERVWLLGSFFASPQRPGCSDDIYTRATAGPVRALVSNSRLTQPGAGDLSSRPRTPRGGSDGRGTGQSDDRRANERPSLSARL